ncbi:hypothetical protein TNCV_4152081 [Trichonephila clavipes]|nr:hypothetical protein TNCV_4152081 [Trichonephila clavipes]
MSHSTQPLSLFIRNTLLVIKIATPRRRHAIDIIAARSGRDPMIVSRIWNRWVQDGNTERRAGSQRPLSLAAKKTGMLPACP